MSKSSYLISSEPGILSTRFKEVALADTQIIDSKRKIPKQRRAQETVSTILQATAQVLVERGYQGLTTNRVAEVSGFSIGSLYQYFPNKQSLLFALVESVKKQEVEVLERHLSKENLSVESLVEEVVEALIEIHQTEPELRRAIMVYIPESKDFCRNTSYQQHVIDVVGKALKKHANEIRVLDPKMSAFILLKAVQATIDGALDEDPKLLKSRKYRREIAHLIKAYLKPIS
jgi:AcrR family transcriptional regulator